MRYVQRHAHAILHRAILLVTAGVFLLVSWGAPVAAQSDAQNEVFDNGIYTFNTERDECSNIADNTTGAAITGNNPRDAFNFFVTNGYTAAGAAGIVGNMQAESTANIVPTTLNSTNHYGIVQWSSDRTTKMRAFVLAEGKNPATLDGQLDYVLHELKTDYKSVGDYVKVATDAAAAATYFNVNYEVSGDTSGTREKNATTIYGLYASSAPLTATPSSSTCNASSTISPQCATAAGNAKILCSAELYQGLYYRWGGGHQPYKSFAAACPDPQKEVSAPDNLPTGGPGGGNPNVCATDCSGLVTVATDAAFGQNYSWLARTYSFGANNIWKPISFSNLQSGDILLKDNDHVEIVDHVSGDKVTTFGSHQTGTKTGFVTTSLSYWTDAMRYYGPGSTGN